MNNSLVPDLPPSLLPSSDNQEASNIVTKGDNLCAIPEPPFVSKGEGRKRRTTVFVMHEGGGSKSEISSWQMQTVHVMMAIHNQYDIYLLSQFLQYLFLYEKLEVL